MNTMLKPDTVQKLDALTRAIEEGKLDDIIKKVQFVEALRDEKTEGGFEKLVAEVAQLRNDLQIMTNNYMEIKADMTYMAQGMRAVLELNKKLEWNKNNIENVCSKYNAY